MSYLYLARLCRVKPNLGSAASRLLYRNAREGRLQDSATNANNTVHCEVIIVVSVRWLIASRVVHVIIFASCGSVTLANHSTVMQTSLVLSS